MCSCDDRTSCSGRFGVDHVETRSTEVEKVEFVIKGLTLNLHCITEQSKVGTVSTERRQNVADIQRPSRHRASEKEVPALKAV